MCFWRNREAERLTDSRLLGLFHLLFVAPEKSSETTPFQRSCESTHARPLRLGGECTRRRPFFIVSPLLCRPSLDDQNPRTIDISPSHPVLFSMTQSILAVEGLVSQVAGPNGWPPCSPPNIIPLPEWSPCLSHCQPTTRRIPQNQQRIH